MGGRTRGGRARVGTGYGSVGFLGAGALTEALAGGLLAAGLPAERIWVCNRADDARLERFRRAGLHATRAKADLAAADTVVLAVKPGDAATALGELRPVLRPGQRVLSCMAGVSTAHIEEALGGAPRVLRAMPNVASAVRASATALCAGRHCAPGDLDAAARLLSAVGLVVRVDEALLDAATAVAGSGPAYVLLLAEAMAAAGQDLGLPGTVALQLTLQTLAGAARLALETERPPAVLRAAICSPGGTTLAGLRVLEDGGFADLVGAALRRAAERSRELGSGGPSGNGT